MFLPRVIPTLLLKNNGLVKTKKFKNEKYIGDPINAVKIFNEKEVDEIVFLDIDASKNDMLPDYDMINRIASECFMPLAYGGGINNIRHVDKILNIGVEKIVVNSYLFRNINFIYEIANIIGSQSVVVSIDIKKSLFGNYKIYSHSSDDISSMDLVPYLKKIQNLGAGEVLINSVDRDGTMGGYDIDLIKLVANNIDIPVIACGGAGSVEDFKDALENGGASAVSAGSMFVFHGVHNAVLINYLNAKELKYIYDK